MFCKKCGANLEDDALFCENCGTAVKQAEPVQTEQVVTEPTAAEPIAETVSAPAEPVAAEAMPQEADAPATVKTKKAFPIWVIIAAVAVVAVIAIVLILGGSGGKSADSFFQEMNYNNVAHFAYDNSRLYFVAKYDDNAEETSVFSTDYKGINKKMIADNANINRIRVVDGKLYYLENLDEEYKLGVMDTDGSNDSTIVTSDESVTKFAVSGKNLYYLTESGLYAYPLGGGDRELLVENASTFTMGNGALYYVADDVISAFDLKKSVSKELCKSAGATDLALDNNTLYFVCDSGLSCADIKDGTITRVIIDSELDSYIIKDESIYYKRSFDSDEIDDLANYLADDSSDLLLAKLFLIGVGNLYQADKDGSNVREIEGTDDSIVFTLYTYPDGLYHKKSAFSNGIEPVEFN